MNYREKTQMDMPDIDYWGDEGDGETSPWPNRPPVMPTPDPMDEGRDARLNEGCICIALLSLSTTVISLLMLKGKIM